MPLQKLSEKCYQTGRIMSSFCTVHTNVDGATGLGSEIPFHINGYEAVRVYEKTRHVPSTRIGQTRLEHLVDTRSYPFV
jgi:hypothetical protein